MIQVQEILTPLGWMLAVASDTAVLRLQFTQQDPVEDQIRTASVLFKAPAVRASNTILIQLEHELQLYFQGKLGRFLVPVQVQGTEFEMKVWNALAKISYGTVQSYQEVARAVGSDRAMRAVGNANAQNLCAIIIPCHRVIEKSGKIGGYAGGIDKKIWLLDHEQRTRKIV